MAAEIPGLLWGDPVSWIILSVLFCSVLILIYMIFLRESRVDRMLKKFPGERDYPIGGHAHRFLNHEKLLDVFDEWSKKYNGRCRVYFGSSLKTLMISKPCDLEKVTSSTELIYKSRFYDHLHNWLGNGLLTSGGEKWKARRRMLTPAFHFKILENFQPIFDECSKVLVNILKNLSGEECEIQGYVTRCTLDVICETAMGKKLNCQMDKTNEFLRATLRECDFSMLKFTNPWYQNSLIWRLSKYGKEDRDTLDTLHKFTKQVISERKKNFSAERTAELLKETAEGDDEGIFFSSKSRRFAFLDLLLSLQASGEHGLSDQDIVDETDTFMFTGHDTTASSLSWTIYLLGLHPDEQALVHEELDSVFGEDKSRPVEHKDLAKLKYLEMCIKESQRLYPVVNFISRLVTKDFKLDENSIVPKDAIIALNVYSAFRDPESFPEPEKFQPDRFSPENRSKMHPFAFIPFLAGPRNCIGQRFAFAEEKTILANLFRNFRAQSLDPPEKVKAVVELVLRAKNPGIRMKFIPR